MQFICIRESFAKNDERLWEKQKYYLTVSIYHYMEVQRNGSEGSGAYKAPNSRR